MIRCCVTVRGVRRPIVVDLLLVDADHVRCDWYFDGLTPEEHDALDLSDSEEDAIVEQILPRGECGEPGVDAFVGDRPRESTAAADLAAALAAIDDARARVDNAAASRPELVSAARVVLVTALTAAHHALRGLSTEIAALRSTR